MKKVSIDGRVSLFHICAGIVALLGLVGVVFSEKARIDVVTNTQVVLSQNIERVEDSIETMNRKLDTIVADLHYLRGVTDSKRPTRPAIPATVSNAELEKRNGMTWHAGYRKPIHQR